MSSILTNTSAMVALQTLRSTNQNLSMTQSEISTGKSISTAKDNASIWAISKVMESDVEGFNTISSNLSLGESTVGVARAASETVTDLLRDIKGKIVDATADNKDRGKIQDDIDRLVDQIDTVVNSAQFNGLNLVSGEYSETNNDGNVGINVLSSLDRQVDGSVSTSHITVDAVNLSTTAGAQLDAAVAEVSAADADGNEASISTGDSFTIDLSGVATSTSADNIVLKLGSSNITFNGSSNEIDNNGVGDDFATQVSANANFSAAYDTTSDTLTVTYTGTETQGFSFVSADFANTSGTAVALTDASSEVDLSSIAGSNSIVAGGTLTITGLDDAFQDNAGATGGSAAINAEDHTGTNEAATDSILAGDRVSLSVGTSTGTYTVREGDTDQQIYDGLVASLQDNGLDTDKFDAAVNAAGDSIEITSKTNEAVAYEFEINRGNGTLSELKDIDVTTPEGADLALGKIEVMLNDAIDASAAFGSAQGRLETQNDFVSKLTDSLKAGIGSLVDADMEEVSARLQSLQVQQQLGVQALSIANQQPQTLLSLFR